MLRFFGNRTDGEAALETNFNASGVLRVVKAVARRWFILNLCITLLALFLTTFGADILRHRAERAEDMRAARSNILKADNELQALLSGEIGPAIYEGAPLTDSDIQAFSQAADTLFPLIDSIDQTSEPIREATAEYEASVSALKRAVRTADPQTVSGITELRATSRAYGDAQEGFESAVGSYLDDWKRRLLNWD